MTRVLVVDDSAFMRQAVQRVLKSDPSIEIVGTASDGIEAIEQVRRLKPDVVTLDVEMPRMDGLKTLGVLMRDHPVPVVMLSTLTKAGAPATIRALELGAVDFVTKPAPPAVGLGGMAEQLVRVVQHAARARVRRSFNADAPARPAPLADRPRIVEPARPAADKATAAPPAVGERAGALGRRFEKIVAIGCSTGGPRALVDVVPRLPRNLPAGVLIVQHMPAGFTRSLAERLDGMSALHVREAEEGDRPEPGLALLAPGGRHMALDSRGRVTLTSDPPIHGVRPAVDVLFASLPPHYGRRIVAAVLTGMGNDGADGAAAIKDAGGRIVVEDQSTTVVYGMPRAVAERGLAERSLPIQDIAGALVDMVLLDRAPAAKLRAAG